MLLIINLFRDLANKYHILVKELKNISDIIIAVVIDKKI